MEQNSTTKAKAIQFGIQVGTTAAGTVVGVVLMDLSTTLYRWASKKFGKPKTNTVPVVGVVDQKGNLQGMIPANDPKAQEAIRAAGNYANTAQTIQESHRN